MSKLIEIVHLVPHYELVTAANITVCRQYTVKTHNGIMCKLTDGLNLKLTLVSIFSPSIFTYLISMDFEREQQN